MTATPPDATRYLAAAGLRVTRGTPTAEEVAALTVLLVTRLSGGAEEPAEEATPTPTVWRHPGARFRPPGAWAS
ncbi:acyl-CoA carboxylase subunit epsilon [Streptomyces sp. NPDC046915]|uniref:acyl-CoA carboxylase subunit epsilon n=1 Tax=Streptomyces sp. NPDC046915 TaxID=3155257 RepID=UPI0033CDF4A7